ncbi:hypothetical protein CEP52_012818 [Fusarium oligoseptatum]|uniref:Protein kinase domain-containing protein n=1 Tax=Fusarium oligoseptatum TaxID=2604345 RepID=A0A428SWD9_9HYPO|nr:hypothetical protein CEP52_012818 [Fusarium oligoseptatum]
MTAAPRYEIEHHITSTRDDDHDARFTVRRNGKAFYIKVSPSQFSNSPMMTEKYLSYLEVLRSGEEVLGDIYDTDVYEWVMAPFEPLFAELAPSPPCLPEDIMITLQDHLFPEFFVFALDIVDEKAVPAPCRSGTITSSAVVPGITLSFKDPEDALFKPPNKVLIDNRQTECFFKPCNSSVQIKQELKAYKMILAAGLDSQLYLCHLYGVVMDDSDFILGLLLTYINNGDCPLSTRIHPDDPDDPPPAIRERWVGQLDAALAGLHKAGVVWGDVKAENVLIDRDNNAWITDFGGGYTEGWVDKEIAGTVEGDLVDPKEVADCWDWSLAEDGFSGTWAHSLAFLLAEGTARAQVRASLFTWSSPVSTRIGLQYSWERGWGNPEDETARLLAMNEVGKMPKVRYNEMDGLMRSIVTKVSRDWNCQNWVREALGVMVEKGLMTEAEKEKAEEEQRKAIALPFTSETPNKRALKD